MGNIPRCTVVCVCARGTLHPSRIATTQLKWARAFQYFTVLALLGGVACYWRLGGSLRLLQLLLASFLLGRCQAFSVERLRKCAGIVARCYSSDRTHVILEAITRSVRKRGPSPCNSQAVVEEAGQGQGGSEAGEKNMIGATNPESRRARVLREEKKQQMCETPRQKRFPALSGGYATQARHRRTLRGRFANTNAEFHQLLDPWMPTLNREPFCYSFGIEEKIRLLEEVSACCIMSIVKHCSRQ